MVFACRPENTEMWPPGKSTDALSVLDTACIRAAAARGGTMWSVGDVVLRVQMANVMS